MKPPLFAYRVPESVEEALAELRDAPDEASLLAGGQSLVPMLNLRLARPSVVVDLNRIAELAQMEETPEGGLRIGSMVRQHTLEVDASVRERFPLVAAAVGHIAHLPIRTRGTVGGSLAHADPAAELPATVKALRARMLVRGGDSATAAVAAEEFFVGPLMTAIEHGSVLVGIELDPLPSGTGWAFLEIARTHGAFALAGAAALIHADTAGRIDLARLALFGIGGTAEAPSWLDELLVGEEPSAELFAHTAERVRETINPHGDMHAGPEYRRSAAAVLTRRALMQAAARAGVEVEQ